MRACFVVLLLLISSFISIHAATYYVSTSGNDANAGTNQNQPWKTLEKVNSFNFSPGDQILFRRGDEWRGILTVKNSGTTSNPIVFGSYGTGAKPKIYGSEIIIGWSHHSGNIYKATVMFQVGQVFLNGARTRAARYPDEGYLYITSVQDSVRFTSESLDADINYTGAKWFGRTRYYFGVLRDVVASTSKTLTLKEDPHKGLSPNIGFFLMNKLEFLTRPGEWFYDEADNTLYLWTPNGDTPASYTISGSGYPNGISINNVNYITIEGLDFREQNDNGISIRGGNNIKTENNDIFYPDQYGIYADGGSFHSVKKNKITNANGGGMLMWIKNSQISDNFIDKTAVFSEIGLKGTTAPNGGSGAEISGEGNTIEYNIIDNSNYNGLFYRGESLIQYNYINNSCLYKDDGGAIYTNTSGSRGRIRYNIVENSIGNPEGFISTRSMAEGIYIDEIAENVIVEYNTIKNCGNSGIKLHHVGNIQVRNNNIMSARYGFFCNKYVGTPSSITNNTVLLTSASDDYEPRQLFARVSNYNANFNYNTYVNPYASSGVFRESVYMNFDQWKSATNHDANSKFDGTSLAPGETYEMFYNNTRNAKLYNLNGAIAKNVDGNTVTGKFVLQPFTSIILIGTNLNLISDEIITGLEKRYGNFSFEYYPNPFDDHIIFSFLGSNSHVTIDIINVSGSVVTRLFNGPATTGQNKIVWNGKDGKGSKLPAGLYFVRYLSGNLVETGKIIRMSTLSGI
jgi:parallel beta-helix repeat protein